MPFLLLLACAVPVLGGFHLQTYWSSSVPRSETQFLNVFCHTDFISVGSLRPQLCSKFMLSCSICNFIIILSYGVYILLVVIQFIILSFLVVISAAKITKRYLA